MGMALWPGWGEVGCPEDGGEIQKGWGWNGVSNHLIYWGFP